tara:strand:+ start:233 stop:529 length:297 start_codon:yes stop_codon:yes gene_type:complete
MIGTEVFDAIKAINPSAKFIVRANSVDQIEWTDGTTPISKSDIEAKMVVLQNEYNNNKYQRDRQKEYPSVVDQLDDIYHNGIDAWKATIKTTKDKYPK